MEVLAWTRTPRTDPQIQFTAALEEVLRRADIITIHLPKSEETAHLISTRELEHMKEGVFIINTARGGIVDEEALLHALQSGKVRGAGLDVFENEPAPSQALIAHSQVVATPHIAALTHEAQERAGIIIAEQLIQSLSQT
jgi:D-3-phosphoglycerate dehydrogenase